MCVYAFVRCVYVHVTTKNGNKSVLEGLILYPSLPTSLLTYNTHTHTLTHAIIVHHSLDANNSSFSECVCVCVCILCVCTYMNVCVCICEVCVCACDNKEWKQECFEGPYPIPLPPYLPPYIQHTYTHTNACNNSAPLIRC